MVNIQVENVKERLGNIDQIRDLLFGHIVVDYEQRFQKNWERVDRLEVEFQDFQTEIRDRLSQLQESLTAELRSSFASLDQQVQYLKVTSSEQSDRLETQVEEIGRQTNNQLASLHANFASETSALKTDFVQTKEQLTTSLKRLEQRVFEEIQRDLSSFKTGKVSRVDLADFLFEVCLKLKGAEFVPQLTHNGDRPVDSEYLLPEQPSSES